MARSKLNPNQVTEDTIEDADGDTKVMVEQNADEDWIRFNTDGNERMVITNGGKVGIGISTPTQILTLNGTAPTISFKEANSDRAEIGVNDSDNLVIENKASNRHIVFKASDAGTVREGLRLDGAVPEVVVNQTSDSLVNFRVESDNNTHMIFVDGSSDVVGIKHSSPASTLTVGGSISMKVNAINAANDPGTSYTITSTDCVIAVNTRPSYEGGIDSAITLTLPDASDNPGMVVIVKDSAGYANVNNITISRAGSDTIEGVATTLVLNNIAQKTILISDGVSAWLEIAS